MSVNIGEANQGDAFYRYKMPKLQSRVCLACPVRLALSKANRLTLGMPWRILDSFANENVDTASRLPKSGLYSAGEAGC